MKFKNLFASLAAAATLASVGSAHAVEAATSRPTSAPATVPTTGPSTQPDSIDLPAVNAQVKKIVDGVFTQDNVIKSLSIQLDPQRTRIDGGQVAIDFDTVAKTSAWAPGQESTAKASVRLGATGVPNSKQVDVNIDFSGKLDTAVVAFLANYFPRVIDKCDAVKLTDVAQCEQLKAQIAKATTTDESFRALSAYAALEQAASPVGRLRYLRVVEESENGKVKALKLVLTEPENVNDWFNLVKVEVNLSATTASFEVGLGTTADSDNIESVRAFVVAQLNEVAAASEDQTIEIRNGVRDYLQYIKKFFQGLEVLFP